jgi:hypothetical protein
VPSVTARRSLSLLQIADSSLSCHHSNTDPTTLLDVNNNGSTQVACTSSLRRVPYLLGV